MKKLTICCFALLFTGCVSLDKLDKKMPLINAEEITVTAKTPFIGTARIHAKNLVNTEVEKTADEYIASLDTPWGTVSYEAKGYKRTKKQNEQ